MEMKIIMGGTANNRSQQPSLSRDEVDRRIAELRIRAVPARRSPENLDRALDPAIRVDADAGRSKLTLVVDGVDASWATVIDFEQQIGCAVIRMGGIAGVGTRDDQRFKGYSRRVLESCLRWMRGAGYHTTMLYGIQGFYPKFGYAKAFPGVWFSVTVRTAEEAAPAADFSLVPFVADRHLRSVLKMYHANNAGRTGVTRRSLRTWPPFRKGLSWNSTTRVEVFENAAGKAAGYLVFDGKHCTANVIEVGFVRPAVFPAILRRAAEFAWEQRLESVHFHLPEDHPFSGYCAAFGMSKQVTWSRDGGGMIRMIDCVGALEAVRDELSVRARDRGALTLKTNLGAVSLAWEPGRMRVVRSGEAPGAAPVLRLPQWALAQLLYGARAVPALVADGALKGSRAGLEALDRLFPARPHFQYPVDHF
jgi:predicted acetyltransferase